MGAGQAGIMFGEQTTLSLACLALFSRQQGRDNAENRLAAAITDFPRWEEKDVTAIFSQPQATSPCGLSALGTQ